MTNPSTFRPRSTLILFLVDGDGKTDPAIFRPSTGVWYILKSSTNDTTSFGVSWGLGTDVPLLARQ